MGDEKENDKRIYVKMNEIQKESSTVYGLLNSLKMQNTKLLLHENVAV